MSSDPLLPRPFTIVPAIVGALATLVACLVLIDRWVDFDLPTGLTPNLPALAPNSALGLFLLGLALWLLRQDPVPRHRLWSARAAAAIAIAIGLLSLAEYAIGRELGIDRFPFRDSATAGTHADPVRVSFTTALALVLLGTALATIDVRPRRGPQPAQVLAVLATLIALLAVLGYAAGMPAFYGAIPSIGSAGTAPPGAVLIALLGTATVCARPEHGLMAVLRSHGTDGVVARRLLLVPVVLPLLTGLVHRAGQRWGLYQLDFGEWFFSISNIAIFTLGIWAVAEILRRTDAARRLAVDQLRESAGRIQDLYDNAPCGYHSVGPDGIVIAMNPTELNWLGYGRDDVIGRMRFADVVCPKSREAYRAAFARVRERGSVRDVELELIRRDGSALSVLLNSTAVLDPAGQYLRSRTTLVDVTERRRAETVSRLFAEVASRIPLGLLIYRLDETPTLRVVSGNAHAEELLGVPLGRVAGLPVVEVFPAIPDDQVRRYSAVAATGTPDDFGEFRYGDDRVAERWWAVQAFPLPDRSVGVAFRDVSDRKRAEEEVHRLKDELEMRVRQRTAELADANRELVLKNAENEMFVYSVSHDLRSPLVNLQGFSKELEKGCRQLAATIDRDGLPADVRDEGRTILDGRMSKSLGFIQAAVLRLGGIIDALLRLSRAGRVEYRWERIDMNRLIAQVIGAAQGSVAERGASVRVDDLPAAWGDRTAIEQIFGNLVGNALTYLDPARPGRIEIGVLGGNADGVRTYYVRDNGLGIAESHQPKIFQAFQRSHPGIGSGEGLGLAIVARAAARHGGRAWVESRPGEGSTFFVALPILPETIE